MHSSANIDYTRAQFTIAPRTSFTFALMACSHARIALSQVIGLPDINTYEIVIGTDNTLPPHTVQLNRNGVTVKTGSIREVVECIRPKQLWVSWENGVVQFGSGSVIGQQLALTWKDSDRFDVSAVMLSGGPTESAIWFMQQLDGMLHFSSGGII